MLSFIYNCLLCLMLVKTFSWVINSPSSLLLIVPLVTAASEFLPADQCFIMQLTYCCRIATKTMDLLESSN